jgi:hypothetical protein
MNHSNIPPGPFDTLVVLGESTVEGGNWLAKPEERWADVLAIVHNAPGITTNIEKRDAQTEWTRQCLMRQSEGL